MSRPLYFSGPRYAQPAGCGRMDLFLKLPEEVPRPIRPTVNLEAPMGSGARISARLSRVLSGNLADRSAGR